MAAIQTGMSQTGVLQGSHLGPLLHFIFTNELLLCVKKRHHPVQCRYIQASSKFKYANISPDKVYVI